MPFLSNELLAALPRLRRYARFLVDDPASADQLVEQTLARARQSQDEDVLDMTSTVRLLSMLRSVYADEIASHRLRAVTPALHRREPNPPAGQDSAAPEAPSHPQRVDDLLVQLFRLPVEQREVLVLVAIERLSYDDTAALLEVPVATVFARLAQAREALRSVASRTIAAPKSGG